MRQSILGAAAVGYDGYGRGETAKPLGSLVALCARPDPGLDGTREDASRGDFIVNAQTRSTHAPLASETH
jgi:hypothetical protein